MARIYLASSWRNTRQPVVAFELREAGHDVYDFRHPGGKKTDNGIEYATPTRGLPNEGFQWSEIDPKWRDWTPNQYREAVQSQIASHGFTQDFRAMQWADTCVLLLPSGRSAHLEAGWMSGAGKRTCLLMEDKQEPELMNLMLNDICLSMSELIDVLGRP